MAVRKIAQIGAPVLRQRARELSPDELRSTAIQTLIDDLIETMRAANGAGLAAPQISEPIRICAMEVKDNPRYPYKPNIPLTILVNPSVEILSDDTFENYEGCLSVPDLRGVVRRHAEISVRGLDRRGGAFETTVRGFTAGTYQHEIDHLDATLFVDRVTDATTLTTWENFDAVHREAWLTRAATIVERWGS